jgi:hypothetical protein
VKNVCCGISISQKKIGDKEEYFATETKNLSWSQSAFTQNCIMSVDLPICTDTFNGVHDGMGYC